MASIVSERYARSLFEVAKEVTETREVLDDMLAIAEIFRQHPDLMKVMQTPFIGLKEKKNVLETIFGGRISAHTLNFLMLITEKRRIGLLDEMVEEYKQMVYMDAGICEVIAITAAPMGAALKDKLKDKMCAITGKEIVLKTAVDPAILGGIIVKIENKQMDNSVKTKLEELSGHFAQMIA